MAINYVFKPGLNNYLGQFGYRIEQIGSTWVGYYVDPNTNQDIRSNGSDDIADAINGLISSYNPLTYVQGSKIIEVKDTAVALCAVHVRPMTDYDTLRWLYDVFLSVLVLSRSPNTSISKLTSIAAKSIAFFNDIYDATDWQTLYNTDYTNQASWNIS